VRYADGLERITAAIDWVVRGIVGLLMASVLLVVLLAVFFRYVLNASLFWGEEAARYLTVWIIFLSIGVAYRTGGHVRISTLLVQLPPGARRWVRLLGAVTEVVLMALLAWYGWVLAFNNLQRGQLSPALQIPIGWVYLAVPVGLGLTLLHAVVQAMRLLMDGAAADRGARVRAVRTEGA
jgi:TRAP-type C4-dicarboxylate transport system permease small subunit